MSFLPLLPLALSLVVGTQQPVEEGGFAPPGRWLGDGGSASRSGTSLSRPIRRAPVEAWSVTTRGRIDGEPRVFDGEVVLSVEEGPGRRAVQVLELATGRTLLHQVLPASTPLEPTPWMDRLCLRPAQDRVDVYRVRTGRLFLLRSIRAERSISSPVLLEGELYLRVDDELRRYDLDRNDPLWTASVEGVVRGTPAVRGAGVFALCYDARGNAQVASFARPTGQLVALVPIGHHGGEVPDAREPAALAVLPDSVFVAYPRPVRATEGLELDHARVSRAGLALDAGNASLGRQLMLPTEWRDAWLVLEDTEAGARWITARHEKEGVRLSVLADSANHAELLAARTPATHTGDVVYFGGLAGDLSTGDVLWKRASAPLLRPVAADGMLLVVERESTLTALREPERPRSSADAQADEADDAARAKVAEGYALLAYQSLRLGDADLTRHMVSEAVRRGARGRTLDQARDGLERIASGRPSGADPRRIEALRAEERLLLEKPEQELVALARAARDGALQRALLRRVFEHDPVQREAAELVLARIPRDAPVVTAESGAREFDPLRWLDFLDVVAETPVRFYRDDPRTPAKSVTREIELLRSEASGWRADLAGHRSERLYILAGPGRPGAVARCLEVGELVCDLLEEVFAAEDHASAEPMTLLLFESQAEYVEQSRRGRSAPEEALGWTAGHYSSAENLSRVFVPGDDAALDELLGTYAHEMTHHWLATRAPFASRVSDPTLPYWIVEGFATMVEEFRLDARAGTWESENPRAHSLDVVANARPEDLLPWSTVLTMSQREFSQLSSEADTSVGLEWKLGLRASLSKVQLFYAQAGAVCHLLFARPETRVELVRFVESWYRQDRVALDARTTLGDLQELGKRVREHARDVVGGSG